MSEKSKTSIIWAMWMAAAISDFGVALSVIDSGNAIGWVFALPLVVALLGTMYITTVPALLEQRFTSAAELQEKRKRENIDAVLRDLSSDDLHRLKRRLVDGTIDDELLYHEIVGSDGELSSEYIQSGT